MRHENEEGSERKGKLICICIWTLNRLSRSWDTYADVQEFVPLRVEVVLDALHGTLQLHSLDQESEEDKVRSQRCDPNRLSDQRPVSSEGVTDSSSLCEE